MPVAPLPNNTLLKQEGGNYRYRIDAFLGGGGFGITYRAFDLALNGPVVIKELAFDQVSYRDVQHSTVKVLNGKDAVHSKLVKRFAEEAQKMNRFRSPYIVRVLDVWRERGTAYYAMDLIDSNRHIGEPEGGWHQDDAPPPVDWGTARKWGEQLLDALREVHDIGMVHGDIKPDNVLIDKRGSVVLIDFGTARTEQDMARTVTAQAYTPGYAAPELESRTRVKEAGPWSDLYGWGMIMYGMAKIHPGLDGSPLDATSRVHASISGGDPYANAKEDLLRAGVPSSWAKVIGLCVDLDPQRRPRTVRDLLQLQQDFESGAPTPQPPPAVTRPKSGGNRTVVQGEEDQRIQTIGGGGDMAPPPDPPKRSSLGLILALLLGAGAVVGGLFAAGILPPDSGGDPEPSPRGEEDSGPVAEQDVGEDPGEEPDEEDDVGGSGGEALVDPVRDEPDAAPEVVPQVEDEPPPTPMLPGEACDGSVMCVSAYECAGGFCVPPGMRLIADPEGDDAPVFMDVAEVTQQGFESAFSVNPSFFVSCGPNCPVEQVNWFESAAYANARSTSEGLTPCYRLRECEGTLGGGCDDGVFMCEGDYECDDVDAVDDCTGYRLPTEDEWRLAVALNHPPESWASEDTDDHVHPGLNPIAWFSGNSAVSYAGGFDCSDWGGTSCGTQVVQSRGPGAIGVSDLYGNVSEWIHDLSGDRMQLGGSWGSAIDDGALEEFGDWAAERRNFSIGFRLVRSVPPPPSE